MIPWNRIHSSWIALLLLLLLSHFSRVRLRVTPQMAAHQAPPSLGFSRQEHWSGLPFPSPTHESEKWKWSCSVMSDPQRPHGLQPSRLLHPWDFPGRSTGVGCHSLLRLNSSERTISEWLQWMKKKILSYAFHLCIPALFLKTIKIQISFSNTHSNYLKIIIILTLVEELIWTYLWKYSLPYHNLLLETQTGAV